MDALNLTSYAQMFKLLKLRWKKNCYKKSIKKYASNLIDCTAQIYIELIYIDFQTNKMKKSFQIKLKRMKINWKYFLFYFWIDFIRKYDDNMKN